MLLKPFKAIAAAALFCLAMPAATRAADIPPVPDTSDWKFSVALYGWAAGLSGDVGVFGLPPRISTFPSVT